MFLTTLFGLWPTKILSALSWPISNLSSTSIARYIGGAAGFFALKFVCKCVYRITWHPLVKYPGPFLASVTDLYAAYHGFLGDIHLDIWQCHEKYGPFVRYGPNRLLVNSSNGLHDIYGHGQNFQKSKAYLPMVPEEGGWCTLTCIDKSMHRYKRRLITQGLSDDALKAFEPSLLAHIDIFCHKLGEGGLRRNGQWTEPRNMNDYDKWLTLDVMGEFGFGERMGLLESSKHRFIIDVMHFYSWVMGFYEQFPGIAKLRLEYVLLFGRRLLRLNTAAQDQWEDWKDRFAASVLQEDQSQQKGLFSTVLKLRNNFSLSELWAEGSFLMLAGSDTSATTLSGLFFYLAHNPDVHQTLEKEIRSSFAESDAIISGPQLSSCVYLHACINETLRMSPSTPGAPWREAQAGGAVVDGNSVPAGYDVGTCIYALHHREEYFPQSYAFVPERWLSGASVSSEQLKAAHKAFNPFSLGPRGCPGRSLALLQISLTLARVLFDFDFRLAEGELAHVGEGTPGVINGRHRVSEFQLSAHVTASSKGPQLQFRARNIEGVKR